MLDFFSGAHVIGRLGAVINIKEWSLKVNAGVTVLKGQTESPGEVDFKCKKCF